MINKMVKTKGTEFKVIAAIAKPFNFDVFLAIKAIINPTEPRIPPNIIIIAIPDPSRYGIRTANVSKKKPINQDIIANIKDTIAKVERSATVKLEEFFSDFVVGIVF